MIAIHSILVRTLLLSFSAIVIVQQAQAQAPDDSARASPPNGMSEIRISGFPEVSGVAATAVQGEYSIIADEVSDHFANVNAVSKIKKIPHSLGISKTPICDPESIDVGFKPDGTQKTFVLGEDQKTIFVEGGQPISLPSEFYERCGRGAEGISVRWNAGGWDLVVISEGGFYDKTHVPAEYKIKQCLNEAEEKAIQVDCPFLQKTVNQKPEDAYFANDPVFARYWVSDDGMEAQLKEMHSLPTKNLQRDGEAFRTSDITWFKDNVLLLLGSMPKPGMRNNDSYKHTWIKGFSLDGAPIDNMTMNFNGIPGWDAYRKYSKGENTIVKNWEGLDTTSDGRLVIAYDEKVANENGESALLIFQPTFASDPTP
jgi:hypothetical protein